MHDDFQQIRSNDTVPSHLVGQLVESGFATIPGPLSGISFDQLIAAYDKVMASASSGPDFKAGSTTTRMSDLLSHSSVFDEVFLYPSLLKACMHIIGESFKLSSFLGRTLRERMPAQKLHADLTRDSSDAPLLL